MRAVNFVVCLWLELIFDEVLGIYELFTIILSTMEVKVCSFERSVSIMEQEINR